MAAVFSFGLVAFGFLGMGPVTIAVDSYGPVTDNAQSVYELSTIEQLPGIAAEIEARFRLRAQFRPRQGFARRERRGRQHLQGHRQAGTDRHRRSRRATMVFSIVMLLTAGLTENVTSCRCCTRPSCSV
jgi:K(+)-stimulated pyrophosphate-energized sodium pump